MLLRSQRRSLRMLLCFRVHVIPRVRARDEDIHCRSIDRGIIQASRLQSKEIRQPLQFHRHLAAATRAKTPFHRLAALPTIL